ncbi:MAG: branched-chain amino acid ABC transporter permease [Erysipelotrichaceae bacterium]|nr:branched-chain amino acid ABC transporter permease [Erysipelotrichaceae bacterium]
MKNLLNKKNLVSLVLLVIIFFVFDYLIKARILTPYYRTVLYWMGIYIILSLGLNIIIGITGQLSLGHAGFMSIGAYSAAVVLASNPTITGLFIGMGVGIVLTMIVSFIVAMPTLRLKGDYLAIATLGVGEIIRIVILNMTITNGASGISNIKMLMSWPLLFGFVVLTIFLTNNFKQSAIGRACIAIKEDEIAAEAMGINTTKYKVMAFMFGAVLASVAGSLFATTYYVVKPETFGVNTSINILIIVVFGGMGSLSGSIISTIFIGFVNMALQPYAEMRLISYALVLIIVMIFRPQGLMGAKEVALNVLPDFKSFFRKKEKSS